MPTDDVDDTTTDEAAPKGDVVTLQAFTKMRRDMQKKVDKWKAEATAANTRYETAAGLLTTQAEEHAEALTKQQHDFDTERAFDSIGASGEEAKGDRGYMRIMYEQLEASVAEGAPEGTEPSKPSFADWLPGFVGESSAMAGYRPSADVAPKTTALDAARVAAGAVKRSTVMDPATREAQDTGGGAEAPADEAAYGRMDRGQQRAELERRGLLRPREAAAETAQQ